MGASSLSSALEKFPCGGLGDFVGMSMAVLFIKQKTWKQPKCNTQSSVNSVWGVCSVEPITAPDSGRKDSVQGEAGPRTWRQDFAD